jgi:predicted permease
MVRTFMAIRDVPPGFQNPESVLTLRISIPTAVVADQAQVARMHEEISNRIKAIGGVQSVGVTSSVTMDGNSNNDPIWVEDFPEADSKIPALRRMKYLGAGYFETMGNPVIAGRAITWTDIYQQRPVVVISETLAREYWQTPTNAVGKRVRGFQPTWYEVVGVAGPERDDGLNHPPTAIVYWSMLNEIYQARRISYAVRSPRVGSPGFLSELRRAVWSVNPNLPLAAVQTLDEIRSASMAQTSFTMVMLGIAGTVALLLGAVGIYGVIAYIAAQRTREIGIRMALGAQAGDVRRMVLGQGLTLTAVGIGVGLVGAVAATRVMRALLFETSPTDPLTFASVVPVLMAAALLACWVPARRAMRADPIVALRSE